MRILMVSSYLPHPLFSGGHIRLYNLLIELVKNHQITLICEKRNYQTKEDELEVAKLCNKLITVPRNRQWSIKNILKTGFSSYPFLLTGHTNKAMQEEITKVLENDKFDLIHVETFYVAQNIPKTTLPLALTEHNIEYMIYRRYIDQANLLVKPILQIDVLKLKYWEKVFWKKAAAVIAVSDEEKDIIEKEGIKNVFVVPNGVDTEKFSPKGRSAFGGKVQKNEKRALFLGDFRWVKNIDAATWLIKEIWPMVSSTLRLRSLRSNSGQAGREFNLKLWIVGRSIPDSIKNLGKNDDSIIFDENASEETEKIFEKAYLLVAPIRVGGGTSFKILEAMAMRVPVVTTSSGIEGIKASHGKEVLIGDTANDLAIKIAGILQNKEMYKKIANEARKLIEEEYSWKQIVSKLEEIYRLVVKN